MSVFSKGKEFAGKARDKNAQRRIDLIKHKTKGIVGLVGGFASERIMNDSRELKKTWNSIKLSHKKHAKSIWVKFPNEDEADAAREAFNTAGLEAGGTGNEMSVPIMQFFDEDAD